MVVKPSRACVGSPFMVEEAGGAGKVGVWEGGGQLTLGMLELKSPSHAEPELELEQAK